MMEKLFSAVWYIEPITKDFYQQMTINRIIYSGRTKYQEVQIIDTPTFGRCLILDGRLQSSELDEFVYHEALVHPAMITHPNPEKVLILGGGEGATLREVLSHKTVKEGVMIDIDEELVNLCKKYLPKMGKKALRDERARVIFEDGLKFVKETNEKFDVIIMDLPEPLEGTPAEPLYKKDFFEILNSKLTDDGILSSQIGTTCIGAYDLFTTLTNTVKKAFPIARPYEANIPSFGGSWGFIIASKKYDPLRIPEREIIRRIRERGLKTRFYDHKTHKAILTLPKFLRNAIRREKRTL